MSTKDIFSVIVISISLVGVVTTLVSNLFQVFSIFRDFTSRQKMKNMEEMPTIEGFPDVGLPTVPRPLTVEQKVDILYRASIKPSRSQIWNLVWSFVGIISGYALGALDPLHLTHH